MVSFDLNSADILTAVVQYFGLKHCGKVSLVGSMATLVTPTKGNVEGMMPILAHLHQDGNTAVLGETVAESCMARQWIQFKVFLLDTSDRKETLLSCLSQLNQCLSSNVYLAGNSLTAADVVIYHSLHKTVASFSFHDKELYSNLCRWFQHVQQDQRFRRGKEEVQFSKTKLY